MFESGTKQFFLYFFSSNKPIINLSSHVDALFLTQKANRSLSNVLCRNKEIIYAFSHHWLQWLTGATNHRSRIPSFSSCRITHTVILEVRSINLPINRSNPVLKIHMEHKTSWINCQTSILNNGTFRSEMQQLLRNSTPKSHRNHFCNRTQSFLYGLRTWTGHQRLSNQIRECL